MALLRWEEVSVIPPGRRLSDLINAPMLQGTSSHRPIGMSLPPGTGNVSEKQTPLDTKMTVFIA
jgi:hypothetical protein